MDTLFWAADLRSGVAAIPPDLAPASVWLTLAGETHPVPAWPLTPAAHAALWLACVRLDDRWRAGDYPRRKMEIVWGRWTRIDAWALANLGEAELLRARASAPAGELLACRNGLVHLPAWAEGRPCLLPASPLFFTRTALPYDFDPGAPPPSRWLHFLGEVWAGDPESIATLQEWFGYMLLPDTGQQKIGMLLGPRRGGKGTIARVLTQLVGPGNVCTPTLGSLATNFGLQPLIGKTVAIISDARLSRRTDTAVVVERLLSISGEDGQTIDRKHLAQVTCRLPTRFTILTNELPRLNDASGALSGRLVIFRLTRSWYDNEDTGLTDKLVAELPGILLWAMEGWKRLRGRGRFVRPKSSAELVQDMDDLASPIGAFIRERCKVGPNLLVAVDDLFSSWQSWCKVKGQESASIHVFGRDLRAAVPGASVTQPRVGVLRYRAYRGIALRQGEEDADAG